MSVAYTLVDTEEGVRLALPAISSSPYLILDCEGEELGMQGGALSLIQIGTAGGEAAFLFDAARLQRKAGMRALLRLLACPDIRKIVWDGRQDAVALHEKYGVVLAGVLDLQLAEIISRANARGEDDLRRRNRLVCVVGRSHALYKPEKYRHVHALMGLDTCLKDCEVGMEHVKDDVVKKLHREAGSAIWMDRPLSTQLLNYAAHDIYAIAALYEHFRVVKYIPKDCTSLLRWSNRYISVHLARGPPHRDDIYRKGPFLPLDIITSPSGPQVECKGCMRSLSASHFELDSRKERTIAFCRVCEAMKVKANNDAKKAEEAANKAAVCKQRLVAQAAAHAKTDVRGQATAAAVEEPSNPRDVVPSGLVAAFDAKTLTPTSTEELAYLAPLINYMQQLPLPHFRRETMRGHLRYWVPGQPYGFTVKSIEAPISLACERGLLVGGGTGSKAWVRLASHVNDPQCAMCRQGKC